MKNLELNVELATVDEKNFWSRGGDLSSKIWSQVFDALPSIKNIRVVTDGNVVVILKNLIRAFKGLKSLHFAWDHCCLGCSDQGCLYSLGSDEIDSKL